MLNWLIQIAPTATYWQAWLTIASFAALPAGSPQAVLTADFEFDVPVRFDADELAIRQVTHARDALETLPIVEIRDIA